MSDESEVEAEDYEEIVGNLHSTTVSIEAGLNKAISFKESTPNENCQTITPKDRPTLRTLVGAHQESTPEVVKRVMRCARGRETLEAEKHSVSRHGYSSDTVVYVADDLRVNATCKSGR